MNEELIKREYLEFSSFFEQLQNEVFEFLLDLVEENQYANIHVAEIKQRPKNKIKSIESICDNNKRPDKYNSHISICDIKDIAGVRVICHCEDDWYALAEIIENRLNEKRYLDVKREDKGGLEHESSNKKSRPSYRAIHITLSKKYIHGNSEIKISCEIQLRTVMGDAWAVQDRKYIYGQDVAEGDRNILSDSVSEIMNGCEGLWSLVKKKYRGKSIIDAKELKVVKKQVNATARIIKISDAQKFDFDLKEDNL